MPLQSPKIDHLPSDASTILRERYLADTLSVTIQCLKGGITYLKPYVHQALPQFDHILYVYFKCKSMGSYTILDSLVI